MQLAAGTRLGAYAIVCATMANASRSFNFFDELRRIDAAG